MGVAKVPPPRPSTVEPDHAPQTISEDASLMPPRDRRPSLLMSAHSHVLIDSASIPCSSASSPPTRRRLVGRQPVPPVVHLLQMALGKRGRCYRCSRFTLTTVSIRPNCERRGMLSSTVLTRRNPPEPIVLVHFGPYALFLHFSNFGDHEHF